MKRFAKIYTIMFFITNLFLILLQFAIIRRLNIQYDYIPVIIGALIIALFLTLGAVVFRTSSLPGWANLILGFVLILPSLFVLRRLFGVIIFRFSFVIYVSVILIAVVYMVLVFFARKQAKKEADDLNKMLPKENDGSE